MVYKNLEELGFFISRITTRKFFDNSYNINPIPREYTFNSVDFRANIYSSYSDNIYDSFIKEAKGVYKNLKILMKMKNVIPKMKDYFFCKPHNYFSP